MYRLNVRSKILFRYPSELIFWNDTLELILFLGTFNFMIKYLYVLPFHCMFFTPCKTIQRTVQNVPSSRQTQISLRNIRVPYIFLNIPLVRTHLQGVAEMTLILPFQQYCVFSVNPINQISSSISTSEEDMETAFVFLILLTLHKSVNPAKTVTQLVFFQHQLQQKWPMTCPPPPFSNAEEWALRNNKITKVKIDHNMQYLSAKTRTINLYLSRALW